MQKCHERFETRWTTELQYLTSKTEKVSEHLLCHSESIKPGRRNPSLADFVRVKFRNTMLR